MRETFARQPKGYRSWLLRLHKVSGPFCDRKDKSLYAKTFSVLCFPRFSPWALQLPIVRDVEIRMGYFSYSPFSASNLQA